MKNILILITLLITLGFVTSCSEEEHESPFGDFSSFTWWSSPNGDYALTEKSTEVNNYIAFRDLSRGVISHEWKLSEGTTLLRSGFTEADTLNYTSFIKVGMSTTEKLAYVLFTEIGEKEIQLVNTFKDSVAGSINENGVWKASQVFTITVTD